MNRRMIVIILVCVLVTVAISGGVIALLSNQRAKKADKETGYIYPFADEAEKRSFGETDYLSAKVLRNLSQTPGDAPEKEPCTPEDCDYIFNRFAFSGLSDDEKEFVRGVYYTALCIHDSYDFSTDRIPEERARELIYLISANCPELINLSTIGISVKDDKYGTVELSFRYFDDRYRNTTEILLDFIDSVERAVYYYYAPGREEAYHDAIINMCSVDEDDSDNNSAYNVLYSDTASELAYARAFALCMYYTGIDCVTEFGKSSSAQDDKICVISHVCLDGAWYITDTAADDAGYASHVYFNMPGNAAMPRIDVPCEVIVPHDNSTEYCYGNMHNSVANNSDEAEKILFNALNQVRDGDFTVYIEFTDHDCQYDFVRMLHDRALPDNIKEHTKNLIYKVHVVDNYIIEIEFFKIK